MAALVTCATETKLCSVCGRGPKQLNFCTLVTQAATSVGPYQQNAVEERTGGPHIA